MSGGGFVRRGLYQGRFCPGNYIRGDFVRAPLGADPGFLDPWRTMGRLLTSMGRQMDFRV